MTREQEILKLGRRVAGLEGLSLTTLGLRVASTGLFFRKLEDGASIGQIRYRKVRAELKRRERNALRRKPKQAA